MDIFLSINNREQVIQLPVVPSEFKVPSPVNNETYTTINQGDIRLIGQRGLKAITIDTFFPKKDYPFLRSREHWGWEYVEIIESWIDRKMPIRLIITGTPINMAMSIDNFEYGVKDGSGDVYYTLALSEFPFIKLKAKTTTKKAADKPAASKKPTDKKGDMKTNSIVDYLKSIGVDSSMANRKKLAAKYGIRNYRGTSEQNLQLLKKMRGQ